MGSELQEVTRTVNRIVTAPYAVSLSSLSRLLQKPDILLIVRRWNKIKQCQIKPLASVVLADLPKQISSLHILAAFASLPEFRDEVLLQQPAILDSLIDLAVKDDKHSLNALKVCTAILSNTLPPTVVLPRLLPNLIARIVEDVVQDPCDKHTTVLRRLLDCTSAKILEAIPEALLNELIDTFKTVLRHKDAHLVNLDCMAVAGRLSETFYIDPELSSCTSTPSPSTISNWAAKTQCFFQAGFKAPMNVKQTVLRAVFYCKADSGAADEEAACALEAAWQILQMIHPDTLREWGSQNTDIISMLHQKSVRRELRGDLRFYACALLLRLDSAGLHCDYSDLLSTLLRALSTELPAAQEYPVAPSLIAKVCSGLKLYLDPASRTYDPESCGKLMRDTVQYILAQCRPGQSAKSVTAGRLHNADLVVKALRASTLHHPSSEIGKLLLDIVDEVGVPDWWTLSLSEPEEMNCGRAEICLQSLERRRVELTGSVSTFLIELAATSAKGLSHHNFKLLHQQLIAVNSLAERYCCRFSLKGRDNGLLVLLGEDSQESSSGASLDWQERLNAEMNRANGVSRHILIDYVDDVCRDLQNRCDHVEEPLRAMNAKIADIEHKLQACQEEKSETTKKHHSLQARLDASEPQVIKLEEANDFLDKRCKKAAHELEIVRSQLSTAMNDAEQFKNEARTRYEELQLESKAQLMKVIEETSEKSRQVKKMEVDMMWLNNQIPLMRQELKEANEADFCHLRGVYDANIDGVLLHRDELRKAIETANEQLESLRKETEAIGEELKQRSASLCLLSEAEAAWKTEKEQLETELRNAKDRHERIIAAISN